MPDMTRRALFAAPLLLMPFAHAAWAETDPTVPPLLGPQQVKQLLGKPNVVILDATARQYYMRAHIPGAVFTDYGQWRLKGMLPPVERMERLIGSLGIGNGDHVIIVPLGFSAGDLGVATRIFWTIKVLGHDKVSILDGGMVGWMDRRLPIETAPVRSAPKSFKARLNRRWLATPEEVEKALKDKSALLIDNRPPGQHLGVLKPGSVAKPGTIPGSVNVPEQWLAPKGRLLPKDRLAKLHKLLKADADTPSINFCNTGHRASLGWFVKSQILGRPAKLYDGSMAEWSRLPGKPVMVKLDLAK